MQIFQHDAAARAGEGFRERADFQHGINHTVKEMAGCAAVAIRLVDFARFDYIAESAMTRAHKVLLATIALAFASQATVHAQKKYDPGATDTEIKLGQTMPYSGPASAFGTMGRTEAAYFQM